MRQETISVYQFDELSDKAKENARAWYREAGAGDNYFAEATLAEFPTIAAFCGWTVGTRTETYYIVGKPDQRKREQREIYFSGFWSQGDGAQFAGTWRAADVNAAGLKEYAPTDKVLHGIADRLAALAASQPAATATVTCDGRDSHKYATEFDVYDNSEAPDAEYPCEPAFAESLTEATRDLMQWLYDTLESEYEYHDSDEAIDETIRANEYDFTADGSRSVTL